MKDLRSMNGQLRREERLESCLIVKKKFDVALFSLGL